MIINIQGKDIELTEALKQYAHERAEGLHKFFDNIQQIDVIIGMDGHHHQKGDVFFAEMNVHVPGNNIVVSKFSDDLYKAIDKVKDHLKVEFEKLKGKMRNKDRNAIRREKTYQE